MWTSKTKLLAILVLACLCAAIGFLPLSRSNNLLLGKVEATVDNHTVVVTDCYRMSVPPPQKLEDSGNPEPAYRFMPCRDADILIRGGELTVNGKSYGRLDSGDAVTVDHGKVLINEKESFQR